MSAKDYFIPKYLIAFLKKVKMMNEFLRSYPEHFLKNARKVEEAAFRLNIITARGYHVSSTIPEKSIPGIYGFSVVGFGPLKIPAEVPCIRRISSKFIAEAIILVSTSLYGLDGL